MAIICPTVTATDAHQYREQYERIAPFASRIHLDFMDGILAPTRSPSLNGAWWSTGPAIDLHLMYQKPVDYLESILKLRPKLVIVHAEADGNFVDFAASLQVANIKVGVALLGRTELAVIQPALELIDHVLIFSGDLGHFGGHADLTLLNKVKQLRDIRPSIEIGWDGGINDTNVAELVAAGVDVLNVGGFIQNASDPAAAYATLTSLAG